MSLHVELPSLREQLLRSLSHHYVGPSHVGELLLIALLARGHVLLEGVPGLAKTTLARAFAEHLGCTMRRIQFTPDLLPSDITGGYIPSLTREEFQLRKGPIFTEVLLADEINRAPAKTQSALLEAMQEGQVSLDGTTHTLDKPFFVIATQNPFEQVGTYALPEAQLDRFLMRIRLDYPSLEDERTILRTWRKAPPPILPLSSPAQLNAAMAAVEDIFVSEELLDWMVRLVRRTRQTPGVRLGASPRAALALMRASQARALLYGRDHVLPDDIKATFSVVLHHRLTLELDAELEGLSADSILHELLSTEAWLPKG